MNISLLTKYIKERDGNKERPRLLPYMHSCDGYTGKQIMEDGNLKTMHCKVFDKNLLYLFYGKPSYPVSEKNKDRRTDDYYCPVCFIVNPEKVQIYRVFPFDTGAFCEKKYYKFIHRNMKLEDYELENSKDAILNFITVMYGNNEAYLKGNCQQNKSTKMEIQAFLNMLNARGAFEIDERANTVEIITQENINLIDAIECIILPRSLMEVEGIFGFINNNNIKYKMYNTRKLTSPDRYNEIVFQLVMEFIQES